MVDPRSLHASLPQCQEKTPKVYRKPNAGLYVLSDIIVCTVVLRHAYVMLVCRAVYRAAAPRVSVYVYQQLILLAAAALTTSPYF